MLKALRIPFLMLTIAGLMLLGGCSRIADPLANLPEPIDVHSSTWAFNTDLVINQTIQGGTMSVAMTYDYVYVKYSTANGWLLTATQVHLATTKNGIPHDANGMLPAQFAYKTTHSPNVQTYVYTIPMQTAWRNAGVLYVATHADLVDGGNVGESWGRGPVYSDRSWGMYSKPYVPKTLNLPTTNVHVQYSGVTNCGFGYSPTEFHVWDIPDGYSIDDGYFPSFCLDLGIYIYPQPYYARLWSSYDPTMPAYALYKRGTTTEVPYDKINYLLNVYGGPPYEPADIAFLQHIFWYWRGNIMWAQLTDVEQAAVADADAKGLGFVPRAGEYTAILMDINQTIQLCFLVLDP